MIRIDVHDLTEAFLAAFSLSLSNSFILGRTSSINTLVIIIIHIPLYTGSKLVSEEILLITDPGSALSVHLFGAVFGCCVHNFLTQSSSSYSSDKMEDCREHENNSAVLISSAILFVSLPMLNGIISESDDEMTRAIINTILAGASSLVTSITIMVGMSHLKNRSFNSHVLQGCLVSGGISVASVATLMIQPYGATAIGIITGAVTTLNYLCLEPLFRDSWNLPCSSGIFSFHGVSAMISSVAAIVMASMSEDTDGLVIYHNSLYPIYPARVPSMNYTKNLERIGEIISNYPFLEDKAESRSAYQQAGYQGVGLLISFTTAAIGGIFTGYILRFSEERCGNTMPCTVWQDESFILNRRRYYEGRKRSSVGLEIPDIEVSSF